MVTEGIIMREETAIKHIKNSEEPEKYSWKKVNLFPDGRNWKWRPAGGGADNMRLTDFPIGTLFEFDALSAIYKVVEKKKDSVIVELVDNQRDQFQHTIGEKTEFENTYYGKYGKTVRRPNYLCLPEDDIVDERAAEKAREDNQKIYNKYDDKSIIDEFMSFMRNYE